MTEENGKKHGTVIGCFRDLRAKNPQDNFNIFSLINLLEATHKTDAPKFGPGNQPPTDAPAMIQNAP